MTEPATNNDATSNQAERPRPAFAYILSFLERNDITKERFADKIHLPLNRVTPILNGSRLISHECAFAISNAFPQLKAEGLLHAQAKWRLHQLANPELYTGDQQPKKPGARRSQALDVEEVKRLYTSKTPLREITARTHASLSTIYTIIDEAGIPRRGHPHRRTTPTTPTTPRNPPPCQETSTSTATTETSSPRPTTGAPRSANSPTTTTSPTERCTGSSAPATTS